MQNLTTDIDSIGGGYGGAMVAVILLILTCWLELYRVRLKVVINYAEVN